MARPVVRCRSCGRAWWDHCACLDGGACTRPEECHCWVAWEDRPVGMECAAREFTWYRGERRWVDECDSCVRHGQCRWVCRHVVPGPCSDLILWIGAPSV